MSWLKAGFRAADGGDERTHTHTHIHTVTHLDDASQAEVGHLAHQVVSHQDVSGRQVSVDTLQSQWRHSHLHAESD